MKLTVYFAGDYWVGVAEETSGGRLKAVRHIFGAEPKDGEVLEYVLHRLNKQLDEATQTVAVGAPAERRVNPKRLARQAALELKRQGISSKAQEALKLELEHRKKERRIATREQQEADKARKREIARQKAKDKHRGR